MTTQTVTEATANRLIDSMQKLEIEMTRSTEKLATQSLLNQEQQRVNLAVVEKLSAIEKVDIKQDGRIAALEGWKNWINGVLTAVLIAELVAVSVAIFALTHGATP